MTSDRVTTTFPTRDDHDGMDEYWGPWREVPCRGCDRRAWQFPALWPPIERLTATVECDRCGTAFTIEVREADDA